MSDVTGSEGPKPGGLRERKKARTRASLREHALRLFRAQGYAETTVEQIAEAAEVSPSTFFRYFPTKEDVVLQDDFDPIAIEKFVAQPPELSPIAALRAAMREAFADAPAEQIAQWQELNKLTTTVPELRARVLEEWVRSVGMLADLMAKRLGRDPSDLAVRTLAGAVTGIGMSVMLGTLDDPSADATALMDAGLALLEQGFPL
ncbi:MAG TPA: TetR family transcriptional regulator [Streptosporangiaceae bacterium]|nr:TetR family transcriptional regulator [Streptosporangiaceae bacterium]